MNEPLSPTVRGLTYPLTIVNGNLATSVDYALINQQIRSVVETRYYERVMRANYGIQDNILSVIDPGLINSDLQSSITENVTGLSGVTVSGDWKTGGDDGIYYVFIQYSVNGIPQSPIQFPLSN